MLFCLPSFAFFCPLAALARRLAGVGLWGLTLLASLFLAGAEASAAAPSESVRVAAVIQDYLDGSSYNRSEQLRRAFHADARLYLNGKDGAMREVGIEEYAAWFSKSPGQFNGRVGRLLNVQVDGDIASAKAEIVMDREPARFVDLFLLRRFEGQWKIISKTATRHATPAPTHGRQVLLVVSNVSKMPGTALSSGNSFVELVHAHAQFRAAGYGVQFISPEGGAVPLAYVDTSDTEQRSRVYDADFMWALAHTRKAEEVKAEDYAALMYIGGSAAMFGLADNPALRTLAARLYEQQQAVIAAVCHGSAGLSELMLADGSALVSGKRVTGYPDAFENKNAPYYKSFPFSIEQRLQERKGVFTQGPRNQSHVEVDGRLITGMSWESTRDVVAAIVRQLDAGKPATADAGAARP